MRGTEFGRACGLYDVAMLCSESNRGCIVLAHNMRFKSCFVYCAVSGLWCRDGWEDADDNCVAESRVGCWSRRDTADVICWCEARGAGGGRLATQPRPLSLVYPGASNSMGSLCHVTQPSLVDYVGHFHSASIAQHWSSLVVRAAGGRRGTAL